MVIVSTALKFIAAMLELFAMFLIGVPIAVYFSMNISIQQINTLAATKWALLVLLILALLRFIKNSNTVLSITLLESLLASFLTSVAFIIINIAAEPPPNKNISPYIKLALASMAIIVIYIKLKRLKKNA